MNQRRDYAGEFTKAISDKILNHVAPVLVTLAGAFALGFFEDFTSKTFLHKFGGLSILFIIIIVLIASYITIKEGVNFWLAQRHQNNALILPAGISFDDILPYTIEEEITEKYYSLNEGSDKFDVINKTTYKIKGGCTKVDFIEHNFTGFNLKREEDLTVKMESLSGNPVAETDPVTEKSTNQCRIKAQFITALAPSEVATYRITITYSNYQNYYSLDTKNKTHIAHCKRADLGVKRIDLSIVFPQGYRVLQPEYVVQGSSSVRIPIIENLCEVENRNLNEQIHSDPIKISLVVNNPIPNLRYMLSWCLPDNTMLNNAKFCCHQIETEKGDHPDEMSKLQEHNS